MSYFKLILQFGCKGFLFCSFSSSSNFTLHYIPMDFMQRFILVSEHKRRKIKRIAKGQGLKIPSYRWYRDKDTTLVGS